MLSRSQSTAGDRLQRSNTTATAHTTSSGHHRSSTSIDPFTTRQQAEAAAVEAYYRMRQYEGSNDNPFRPAPSKLQRRRSQVTGRTEGSHFEDARLGRRQSGSKKDDHIKPRPVRSSHQLKAHKFAVNIDQENEGRVITRRRSVIPPDPANLQNQHAHWSLPASSGRTARKSHSAFTDGSPAPRNALTPNHQISSHLQLQTPRASRNQVTPLEHEGFESFGESFVATRPPPSPKRPAIRETQTDEEIMAVARDKCLQDFHRQSLRQRKSFLLVPFQRRHTETPSTSSKIGYDRFLPPFNDTGYPAADVSVLQPYPEPIAVPKILETKSRNFTTTIKGRFLKVIGRSSRVSSGVPVQHIEAKHFHHSIQDPASFAGSYADGEQNPASSLVREEEQGSKLPSEDKAYGSGRSRVTSWTNSTVDSNSLDPDPSIRAAANTPSTGLQKSGSMANLRRTGSIIGNSARHRLRKRSKAELQTSEESYGLFSALKARMKQTSSPNPEPTSEKQPSLRTISALSSLPSRQKAATTQHVHNSTIRTITPVPPPPPHRFSVPSPVKEVNSPPRLGHTHEDNAAKPFQPSEDQIAKGIEKTQNRWQTQLDDLSPPLTAPQGFEDSSQDNPYELPSLRAAHAGTPPHHSKQDSVAETPRGAVLSPSLYSRATDGVSRTDTPDGQGGTVVTITGHEVHSYSISPKKREPESAPMQGSGEWRRWLSSEMHGFHEPPAEYALPVLFGAVHERQQEQEVVSDVEIAEHAELDFSKPSLPQEELTKTIRPTCPRASSSRRSSFMNERYPMLDTSRDSSDRSLQNHRVSSAENKSGHDRQAASVPTTRPAMKQLHSAKSIAQIPSSGLAGGAVGSQEDEMQSKKTLGGPTNLRISKVRQEGMKNAGRPKSALELRAQYRTGTASTSRAVEVRRKTVQTSAGTRNTIDIDDNTIRDISAGPYAPRNASKDVGGNKENSPLVKMDNNALPAISSSEWLAAGSSKNRKASIAPLSLGNGSAGRYSPVRTSPSGKYSPAQRMATDFLEKRSRGSTPAFV